MLLGAFSDQTRPRSRPPSLPGQLDIDAVSNMVIGAFYASYISGGAIPNDWARRVLAVTWPPTQ